MEEALKSYLKKHNVKHKEYKHHAVFTVEESLKVKNALPVGIFHTKNLFLKDEAKNFFLICMNAYQRLDLKSLVKKINAKKKLSFASPQYLKEKLNLLPGSVSIFGLIHDKNHETALILDKNLYKAEKIGFHPNVNTATLVLTHKDLEKFLSTLRCEIKIIDID